MTQGQVEVDTGADHLNIRGGGRRQGVQPRSAGGPVGERQVRAGLGLGRLARVHHRGGRPLREEARGQVSHGDEGKEDKDEHELLCIQI